MTEIEFWIWVKRKSGRSDSEGGYAILTGWWTSKYQNLTLAKNWRQYSYHQRGASSREGWKLQRSSLSDGDCVKSWFEPKLGIHDNCRTHCLWSKQLLHMTSNFAPHDKIVCNVEQFVMWSFGNCSTYDISVMWSCWWLQCMLSCGDLRCFDAK